MSAKIKAYAIYLTVFAVMLIPVMVFVTDPFGEAVARSTWVTLVLAISPLTRMVLPWWVRAGLIGLVAALVVVGHAYVAYAFHHYDNQSDIPTVWLAADVAYYFAVTGIAAYLARRMAPEFGYLGKSQENRDASLPSGDVRG